MANSADQLYRAAKKGDPVNDKFLADAGDDLQVRFFKTCAEELAVRFRRLNGDEQKVTHWKVLFHIVNHATLHRGQVMAMLRQLGHVPPGTDYLFFHLNL